MNCRRTAVRVARLTMLLGVSVSAWPAGAPTTADLARCAAILKPDARLACYDSLSNPTNAAAPAAEPAAKTPVLPAAASVSGSTSSATLPPATAPAGAAPIARAQASAPAAAPAAAPALVPAGKAAAPSPSPSPLDDPGNFGFNAAQVHVVPHGPQSIQAHVKNVLVDRLGDAFVILDNGQMWTYQGDDGRLRPGDSITIKRASLGSFIMVTESKRSYHVERTR